MKTFLLLVAVTCGSCGTMKSGLAAPLPEANTISFVTLNIRKGTKDAAPVVTLVGRSTGTGAVKKRGRADNQEVNYLTLYLYSNRQLTDSVQVEHPLYKHIEYVNADNAMAVKDTVLNEADFFVRFQTERPVNEIRIMETLGTSSGTRALSVIKL